MVKTAMKGDTLYVYAISTIGPVLYRIHRHLDGERAFPDSLVVSLIMVGIMAISVLFFALIRTGVPLDPHAIRQWPVAMYCLSMVFFYYTGVVNAYRERVASPGAAKEEAEKDEARFSESYAERHR
jgi:amino acid transporter